MVVTIRIRSAQGVSRVQVQTSQELYASCQESNSFYLSYDPAGKDTIDPNGPMRLEHGDFCYLHVLSSLDGSGSKDQPESTPSQRLDEVDRILSKRDGRKKRSMDPQLCQHGSQGMCQNCQPLEPWQVSNSSKHLSLHAHLRKQKQTIQDFLTPNQDSKCSHEAGMCSKCLPTSITLASQPYRCVDHVEFEGSGGVEMVVGEWRNSGMQHFAWMFGRVEEYDNVPLGVKATVKHVYIPPQENAHDGIKLLDDECFEKAVQISREMNTRLIGMIYTDLIDDGTGQGKVKPREYFLSSPEIVFISKLQNKHSLSGQGIGSRFVTCVVCGDDHGDIQVNAFQVSQQAQSISLSPSTDPNLLVNSGLNELAFNSKNEYGYAVVSRARPGDSVPVEFFIVSLTHGFTDSQATEFTPFHHHPTTQQALEYIHSHGLSSFHLQMYLKISFGIDCDQDEQAVYSHLLAITEQQQADGWTCVHCTFINDNAGSTDCSMCGLPK